MDSSIPPGPRAIDSKPSVTCENGNTHITDQHNYQHQHSIAKNDHSLCDSSPTDINGNTTTDDVSPSNHSNVLLSISSTTPASLQGPPTIQDINDAPLQQQQQPTVRIATRTRPSLYTNASTYCIIYIIISIIGAALDQEEAT